MLSRKNIELGAAIATISTFLIFAISFLAKIAIIFSYCSDMKMEFLVPTLMNTGNYIVFLAAIYILYLLSSSLGGIGAGITHKKINLNYSTIDPVQEFFKIYIVGVFIFINLVVVLFTIIFKFRYSSDIIVFSLFVQAALVSKYLADEPLYIFSGSGYSPAGIISFVSAIIYLISFQGSSLFYEPAPIQVFSFWFIVFILPTLISIVFFHITLASYKRNFKNWMWKTGIITFALLVIILGTSKIFASIPQRVFYFSRLGDFELSISVPKPHKKFYSRKNFCMVASAHGLYYMYHIISVSGSNGNLSERMYGKYFVSVKFPHTGINNIAKINFHSRNLFIYKNKICPPLYRKKT